MSSLRFLDLSLALDSKEDMPITDCEWVNGGNGDGWRGVLVLSRVQSPTSNSNQSPHVLTQFPAFVYF